MKKLYKIFYIFTLMLAATNGYAEDEKPAKASRHLPKVDYNAPVKSTLTIDIGQLSEKNVKVSEDCESVGNICLTSYIYPFEVVLVAENHGFAVRTLNIDYHLNNMQAQNNSEGQNIILMPGEKKEIERILVADRNYSYTYNYSYISYFGVVDAIHDDSYIYDLPFEGGEQRLLWQGAGGRFSHSDEANYHAYDFKMPLSTPVLAAREGKVVDVLDSYTKGGVDITLKNKMNYVYIQHADGTIANYSHLKHKGSLVNIGDVVQKGQKIALSGNTGYTTNPHLHFGVFKVVRGGNYQSVPIKIKTSDGVKDSLKAGHYFSKKM